MFQVLGGTIAEPHIYSVKSCGKRNGVLVDNYLLFYFTVGQFQ